MITAYQAFHDVLDDVLRGNARIVGVLVADASGLPVLDGFRKAMDPMAVSAMATLVLQSARTVFRNLGLEGDDSIVLEGKDELILVRGLESGASLIVIANAQADPRSVKADVERIRERLNASFRGL